MSEFVALETLLRRRAAPPPEPEPAAAPEPAASVVPASACGDFEETLACVRRFRAALGEALDGAVETLLREIAAAVLARELQLAPVDLGAIVKSVRREFAAEEPVRVRAHPGDVASLAQLDVAVVADPALRRGDVEIDVRDGTVDATLGARLEAVLAR